MMDEQRKDYILLKLNCLYPQDAKHKETIECNLKYLKADGINNKIKEYIIS